MDDSKVLCIGFDYRIDFYDIEEDPLYPKFIRSMQVICTYSFGHLKLNDNLIMIYDRNYQLSVLEVKNYNFTLKTVEF